MLRYKAILDEFSERFAGIHVEAFLTAPEFKAERDEMLDFMKCWCEGTRYSADFLCLLNFRKTLPIPLELQLNEGPFRDVYDEMLAGVLAYVFDIPDFQNKGKIVEKTYPTLHVDDDGLFLGSDEHIIEYCKNGILLNQHFIPYHKWLVSAPVTRSLTGGFIDTILRMKKFRSDITYFGIRLDSDLLVKRAFHVDLSTAAYIWGPKGLSIQRLQYLNFPETPDGTVTVHRRLEQTPFLNLHFRDLSHIEIMWSRRDNLKQVQIEELILPNSLLHEESETISTIYLHSVWNTDSQRFFHVDGARKIYTRSDYNLRVITAMNKRYLKAEQYEKLFRIDASFTLDEWADLVQKFFYNDELIVEYFQENFSA